MLFVLKSNKQEICVQKKYSLTHVFHLLIDLLFFVNMSYTY